jgi:hypothetical protein
METTEVKTKEDLKVGQKYFRVELPCYAPLWIEITSKNEDGTFGYANVAKRHTGVIELYDTFLKSTFDDYFEPTRKRNQKFFTNEQEANKYHEIMLPSEFTKMTGIVYH